MLTILWRLTSLKSNFLRYFPKFVTGKEVTFNAKTIYYFLFVQPEYQKVEGALDIYVGADDRIYKMINRLVTEKDLEESKKFADLKKANAEEVERKERDISEAVAKRLAEEKRLKQIVLLIGINLLDDQFWIVCLMFLLI